MASSATTKAARKAARATVTAALAERARGNAEDLAKFLTAKDRAEAIDQALKDRVETLQAQASGRRNNEVLQQGVALRAMRERGEDVGEIARLAGIDQKTVRELIKVAEQKPGLDPASDGRKQ
jgi:hypothetical protein